ncbi:MAG TPA: hypothetical protein VFA58_04360 [Chthoniobacterales bacterium]|nr:hypothetical protein [Chthoniobacterales bacterium]
MGLIPLLALWTPIALALWQEPMNQAGVKRNHGRGKNYNEILHSFVFLSAESLRLPQRRDSS